MPGQPRPNKKATKIAFKILGTPPNLKYKPDQARKRVNAKLISEETQRVR